MQNRTPKWLVKVLVLLIVSFVTWWATQIWSKQETTTQTNTQQDTSILTLQASIATLQTSIVATDKTVMRIEKSLMEDRIHRKKQDSILIDIAIKVNIMFGGR